MKKLFLYLLLITVISSCSSSEEGVSSAIAIPSDEGKIKYETENSSFTVYSYMKDSTTYLIVRATEAISIIKHEPTSKE